jgi:hypothetical protein
MRLTSDGHLERLAFDQGVALVRVRQAHSDLAIMEPEAEPPACLAEAVDERTGLERGLPSSSSRNDGVAGVRVRRVIPALPMPLATLARYGLRVMPSWSWSSWRSNLLG